jgi:thiamine-phosphate pyrophosphorylase
MGPALPRFYAMVDPAASPQRPVLELCDILLASGVKLIQYRDKRASARKLFEVSVELARRARAAGATLIVNDRADIALASEAGGVHVGQHDLPVELARKVVGGAKLVGYSTHNLEQVSWADRTSADYIAFGPVFATASKENPDPVVGIEGLKRAREATRKPLVAIGGITLERVAEVLAAGADSVAVISDLLKAPDLAARAGQFLEACGAGR